MEAGTQEMIPLKKPPTLTAVVSQHLADLILAGEFRPGDALPEIPLAERLQTSRGTVREALRTLQDLGLVEIQPHRGATVTAIDSTRVGEIISVRALLEAYGARQLIENGRLTPDVLAHIEEAFAALATSSTQASSPLRSIAGIEADLEFHRRITEGCGNSLLLEHLISLQVQTRRLLSLLGAYDAIVENVVEAHRPIMDALRFGDATGAENAVRQHILSYGQQLLKHMNGR